ncbi:hypothetical protein ACF8FG_01475 [Pseudomonas sp. YQ_6]|uniref:dual OB domain-containing protein n=1 Tax=Pseudomonas TaxID=286 RepID=UPI000F773E44|nr:MULTISPECIES: hypothetical protein [Pseudomonas]MBA1207470.1 hypothetical protein [Pseudomonas fulva]MBA1216883.1 hypothetical protein [Pseudomonas fulva]MDH0571551.1 hypothetical protein [Pseudomonas fulva]RRW63727.1 hypothetical protein EGJ51_06965 [Pseudomonas fulva]UNT14580.1 hypothetical protein MOP87_05005 [Pseudomonas sp. I3-I5]
MPYTKLLLCLACSQKPGGFCVAGKEIIPGQGVGSWVRPVSTGPKSAITLEQRKYPDGFYAVKLDLIRIEFDGKDNSCFQAENHFVGATRWRLEKKYAADVLDRIVDAPDGLWLKGCEPTKHGLNDRVHGGRLIHPTPSLYLISVENLTTTVETDSDSGRKKFRGEFVYNGVSYRLWIKDVQWHKKYANFEDGEYKDAVKYLTISLGLLHTDGYAYKLIAAVF